MKGKYHARNEFIVRNILSTYKPKKIAEYAACDYDIARMVYEYYNPIYHWSDIEPDFVEIAANNMKEHPNFKASIIDADNCRLEGFSFYDCLIANSSEHITKDREIIAAMPKNSLIITTLPQFLIKSGGHLRKFESIKDINERYGKLINFAQIVELSQKFIVWGLRK